MKQGGVALVFDRFFAARANCDKCSGTNCKKIVMQQCSVQCNQSDFDQRRVNANHNMSRCVGGLEFFFFKSGG